MPASATVCVFVTDNDSKLSGDSKRNENSDDKSYQTAVIEVDGADVGNGGQIYAEKYYWLKDQDGNWYVMVEIEQEGTGEDYFTFYTGDGYSVPPEGSTLEVVSQCNVKGNWLDMKCLDGGDKEPPTGSISGTVFCDTDCDGINGEVQIVPGCDYTIEAEDMAEYGFQTVSGAHASGGELVKLDCFGTKGELCSEFNGKTGTYDLKIHVQDECDGESIIKLKVNGQVVEAVRLDANTDGGGSDNGGFSVYVVKDLALSYGDDLSLAAFGDGYEAVRIDKIDLIGEDTTIYTPEPTKAGVTIKLLDLDGNVVDTTVTDADGNYTFDEVPAGDYKIMGVAPDGTEFTIQDAGSDDSIDSDVGADGMSDVVTVAPGGEVDVDLGVCEVKLGALEGRYFCDENDNSIDDNETAIVGATVLLFIGNPATGGTLVAETTTDDNGNYLFEDLAAGDDYFVVFQSPDAAGEPGKTFVDPNVGNDDTVDSDVTDIASDGSGQTGPWTVVEGETTSDVDAGIEDPGTAALSGRYFCDTDDDDVDDGQNVDPGIEGVSVALLLDGQEIATTITGPQGNYSFTGLSAGTYTVEFTDPNGVLEGKELVLSNVGNDDTIDSDAIGDTTVSKIEGIDLAIGEISEDNDAGAEKLNTPPEPQDDAGKGCADEIIEVDVLANDSDAEDGTPVVTAINGVDISQGQTVVVNGVEVTLNDGKLSFDGEAAYAFLDIGEMATEDFLYTVEDSDGAAATATVSVTFCGDANSIGSFCDSLPSQIQYQVSSTSAVLPSEDEAFDIKLSSSDPRFDGAVFEDAYCLSIFDPADGGETFDTAPLLNADVFCFEDAPADVFNANQVSFANGKTAGENLDVINWMINQDFKDQGFSDWEIQRAIWELTDNIDTDYLDAVDPAFGDAADVDALIALAIDFDENKTGEFVPGLGDKMGVILDPNPSTPENSQPFIIAVEIEAYDCIC